MKLSRSLVIMTLWPVLLQAAPPKVKPELPLVKTINADVELLEKKISSGELSVLKTTYEFDNPGEGVAPAFSFYFETKSVGSSSKTVLRACKVHVGREVYSNDYVYYFSGDEKSEKYLELNSGVTGEAAAPATRDGIIYDKNGKAVWRSKESDPAMSFKDIARLFHSLDDSANKF